MTELRVYYGDTDAGGVVYYGTYLRFLEIGRTDYFRERGVSLREFHEQGHLFPVVRLEIDYLSPAVYDDLLRIETSVTEIGNASFTLGQKIVHAVSGKLLVDSRVTMAHIGPERKARRLPKELLQVLREE